MSKKVIGIDLGSTLSEVSVIENGKPVVVVNEEGSYTTPSVISLKNGERKVGASAKRQMIVNPKETVNLIKRFMGATYAESTEAIKHVQYDIVENNKMPRVVVEGREYSPEELSSMIITKMKKIAEDYLGEEVTDAVITVPAFFSDAARSATKMAGELAGLKVHRIIAEPTAAILSSNIDMKKGGKYMVVDFGGSTQDNSIADINEGVVEILSTNGDVYLGGCDIDKVLADWVVGNFKTDQGIDLSSDAQAMSRILEGVEKAKIELSNSNSSEVNLPYITIKDNQPLHLTQVITRARFEQLITPIVDRLINCAKEAVKLANIEAKELDGILLVGGSCRIPYVQDRLTNEFNVPLLKSSNFDLAVAEGAAIQANIIVGGEGSEDLLLLDVTPLSLGIEVEGGAVAKIIEANTTIPCNRKQIFTNAVDGQTAITIHVLQGERPMAVNNKTVGMFNLEGLPSVKRGQGQYEISFDIDANGIITVSATDLATNKAQKITIEQGSSLTQEEIDRIKADAKEHEAEDNKKKEELEKINQLQGMMFGNEKFMEENESKLTDEEKQSIKDFNEKLKKAVDDKDISSFDDLQKENQEIWMPISTRLYQSTATSEECNCNGQCESDGQCSTKNDVQDADFEVVD
ncbi:MAG: molecular chaperone DnaK [Bacilli bacterium]|nr:molecular chaperone DnaK [Bacilli bacterium]